MVTTLRANRRGAGTLGCLVSLLVFVAVLYYGFHVGEVYWRYFQLRDEMKTQARLAPSLTDDVIRRRIVERADLLDLPPEAQRIRIKRSQRTRSITITTQYQEQVDLPFFKHTFTLRPTASEPL